MTETARHSTRAWLGIPYATAERFRQPVMLPFDPALTYDQKGPAPIQAGDTSWLEADNGFSENCLNLNVWAPEDAGDEPLPVIVYLFGGGFELGANTQTTSNVSGLAATGRAIGVSLNYRLGPFGWLSLSQYGGVSPLSASLPRHQPTVCTTTSLPSPAWLHVWCPRGGRKNARWLCLPSSGSRTTPRSC
jgi:para-nitrobenzyl esterase